MIGDAVDWSIVIIGAVMIVLVFINVVMHAFGKDMAATTEMCELLMVWVTFLGGAAAARRGAHMAITELIDKLGTGPRRLMDLAISAASAAVLASLVWYGWGITVAGWTNRLTVLDIPMSFQYLALPVALRAHGSGRAGPSWVCWPARAGQGRGLRATKRCQDGIR